MRVRVTHFDPPASGVRTRVVVHSGGCVQAGARLRALWGCRAALPCLRLLVTPAILVHRQTCLTCTKCTAAPLLPQPVSAIWPAVCWSAAPAASTVPATACLLSRLLILVSCQSVHSIPVLPMLYQNLAAAHSMLPAPCCSDLRVACRASSGTGQCPALPVLPAGPARLLSHAPLPPGPPPGSRPACSARQPHYHPALEPTHQLGARLPQLGFCPERPAHAAGVRRSGAVIQCGCAGCRRWPRDDQGSTGASRCWAAGRPAPLSGNAFSALFGRVPQFQSFKAT